MRRYFSGIAGIVLFFACTSKPKVASIEHHLAIARQPGAELYVDRLDNRAILQKEDTAGSTRFCSFLIGWRDSLLARDAGKSMDREKYFQYRMQRDWTAVVDGDSLRAVFLQEKPGPDQQLKQGALVFEVPRGRRVDTLVFRDTYSAWGTQLFVLNGN